MLANGLKVANLWFRLGTRDAAFEDGVDVFVGFTKRRQMGDDKFYPIIQCNRKSPVTLERVMFGLRREEAKKRKVPTKGVDLWTIGTNPLFGAWFLRQLPVLLLQGHQLG